MKSSELNIIGFSSNAYLADKGVSCTNGFLCNHLRSRGIVSDVFNASLSAYDKYKTFIKNASLNKSVWFFKDRISIEKAELKSRRLQDVISKAQIGSANICLQIGSDFAIHRLEKLKKLPKFSYHDNNILAFLKSNHNLPLKLLKKNINQAVAYEKEVYCNIDGIFTMTDFLRNSFIEDFKIPENKVHTIGVGCNLPGIADFEKKYSDNTILFVAKDSFAEKGGEDVIRAFNIVRRKIPALKLIIVGQKIRTRDEHIVCTGFIDKSTPLGEERVIALYKEASVFVMPSYVEATGNVFLEAMACKLPCIGADLSAMPEIIVGNNCGFVAKPGDAADLADKMLCILESKELQMKCGENGFKAVQEKYNWDVVCEKAISIMESCL